jgi:hypothetical protein
METEKKIFGKIYAIKSHKTDRIYIGSTINTLAHRLSGHRRDYKRYLNGKKEYMTSFELMKYEDANIELITNVFCDTKDELYAIEGQNIRTNTNCVNIIQPQRTRKQHYIDNKESISGKQKQYYIQNKDSIAEKMRNYRIENIEKKKLYYVENRETLRAKADEKHICECGGRYTRCHKQTHIQSKKHQVFINSI